VAHIGYVVIDRGRVSPALAQAAISILALEKVGESGTRELYCPRIPVRPSIIAAHAGSR